MRQLLKPFLTVLFIATACVSASAIGLGDLTDLTEPLILAPEDLGAELGFSVVPGTAIFRGSPKAAGTYRKGNVDGIGSLGVLDRGVILSTGDIHGAVGPNVDGALGVANFLPGDADLDDLVAPDFTADATVLEFDFTSTFNAAIFKIVLASDEYTEPDAANDIFGLWVDGKNVALLPDLVSPISIHSINSVVNPALFLNNDVDVMIPPFLTQYDGLSTVLTTSAGFSPNTVHRMKLAVADTFDDLFDTAVFLQAATFLNVSFNDVPPTGFGFQHIEAIAAAGITGGCGGGNFCPTGPVTREQMAAFIIRAIEGEPSSACNRQTFNDVPISNIFCKHIERLEDRGITGGCGGGNYCPLSVVTREQMAAFMIRAVEGEPATACTSQTFNDVPLSNPFCKHIERMAARGITVGCGGGNFCPADPVTREQMAVFLARAFLGIP